MTTPTVPDGAGRRVSGRGRALRSVLLAVLGVAIAGCGPSGSAARTPSPAEYSQEVLGLPVAREGWTTDFSRHAVPLSEFVPGGPGRDGIPPVDDPEVVAVADAGRWPADREPVLAVEIHGRARAYPVQILVWHEIVNDVLGGTPIAVTYCPLCNASMVFDRRVRGRVLRFGTTGNLRRSGLVMWDDRTESWWQQGTGEALVGRLTGERLRALPSQTLAWQDFRRRFPSGEVIARPAHHDFPYGQNPYEGYDAEDADSQLVDPRKADRRLPPKERVVRFAAPRGAVVVPFSRLERDPVAHVDVAARPVVVLYARGVASPLDGPVIARSRDVGTAGAFDRRLGDRRLTFAAGSGGTFVDRETGSTWDITGRAVTGLLRGRRLRPVLHDQQFWFAVTAFAPGARIAG